MSINIAIDGPAGAGKSTIARQIAKELGYIYVDTGAMYRAMALYLIRNHVSPENEEEISKQCIGADISLTYENGEQIVLLNGENVNAFIEDFKSKLHVSLDVLHSGIQNLKSKGLAIESIQPMGAMYLTIKLDYIGKKTEEGNLIENSSDLVFYLIKDAGVALVPFSAFGNAREMPWFRASVGGLTLNEIKEMLPRLEKSLIKLK